MLAVHCRRCGRAVVSPKPATLSGFNGGANDYPRACWRKTDRFFGQTVIVENRSRRHDRRGAIAKAAPDGYNLLMGFGSLAVASVYAKLPFDVLGFHWPFRSPAASECSSCPGAAGEKRAGATALARAHPGKRIRVFRHGRDPPSPRCSCRPRSRYHTYSAKGDTPAFVDLLAGQVDMISLQQRCQHIESGKPSLAVTGLKRTASLPWAPTMQETGPMGYELTAVQRDGSLCARCADRLNGAVVNDRAKDLQDKFVAGGSEP
jgi:hypothetical protein